MQNLDLDESIKAAWLDLSQRTKVSTYEVVRSNFEKIEDYRRKKYPLTVIFSGFKRSGLIDCGLPHFRACYYKCRKQGISVDLCSKRSPILQSPEIEPANKPSDSNVGNSSRTSSSLEELLDTMFAASSQEAEDGNKGENTSYDDKSLSPVRPSLMTEKMAARLIHDKKMFDERIRSMGIVRD